MPKLGKSLWSPYLQALRALCNCVPYLLISLTNCYLLSQVQSGSRGQESARADHFGQGPLRCHRVRVTLQVRKHGQVEPRAPRQVLSRVLGRRRRLRHARRRNPSRCTAKRIPTFHAYKSTTQGKCPN